MCKVVIPLGFTVIFVALWRFLFAPFFLPENPFGASGLLLTMGLFTIHSRRRPQMRR
jgi:hypothetical protein